MSTAYNNIPKTITPYLLHVLRPHLALVAALLFKGLIWACLLPISSYALKLMVDSVSGVELPYSLAAYAGFYWISWAANPLNFRMVDWVRMRLYPALRIGIIDEMFTYLMEHDARFFQDHFAGDLSHKISDISGAAVAIYQTLEETFSNTMCIFIASGVMFFIDPRFCLIFLSWVVIITIVSALFSSKALALSKDFSDARSKSFGFIVDAVSNITAVKSFAKEIPEQERLEQQLKVTATCDRGMQKQILYMRIAQDVTFVSCIGALLWGLVSLYQSGGLGAGDLVLILTMSLSVSQAIWWTVNQLVSLAENIGKCRATLDLVLKDHQITDAPDARVLETCKGDIIFNKVNFHYQESQRVFKEKSVNIPAGQAVGLVGFSGSGKSTFANLIMRFFEIQQGSISIDGVDIKQITRKSLRENIAYVPQEAALFHRTLADNIRFANPRASMEEVIDASKKAHAHEFIETLPDQYETIVGERGLKLSGGQRQRVAIARAILKQAPIILLDEATSALDSVTERHIQAGLHTLMKGKTAIIIAHRLSTLANVDRILVFDNGQIIEDGSHDALMAKGDHYAKLYRMQSDGLLPFKKES